MAGQLDTLRRRAAAPARGPLRGLALAGALVALPGCSMLDDIISVETPDRVLETAIDDPAQATLLVNSVQSAFECAFSGYITVFGLLHDELEISGFDGFRIPLDRREVGPQDDGFGFWASAECTALGVYMPLQRARRFADDVTERLEGWTDAQVPNRGTHIATTTAYAAYAYLLLGEGFCSAAVDLGPELTRAQIFGLAEDQFTRAITAAQAADNPDILNMARVGRARTRLNLGRTAEAAADARLVPADFIKNANYDQGQLIRENLVFAHVNRSRSAAIGAAFRDLAFQGVPDSRVPVVDGNRLGANNRTPWWFQNKFTSENAPIPIAKWQEAQLIIAEVEGGQSAVDIINELHNRAGLPSFSSADPAAIASQVREERRRELFLESHRVGDFMRYDLPLDPPPGTVHPLGGIYGSTRCLPLPDRERLNNPNIPNQ